MARKEFQGLILAAGLSSRFNFMDRRFKKYFLKLKNSSILGYIIVGMIKAGIREIKIVSSKIYNKMKYKTRILKSIGPSWIDLKNFELEIIDNKIPDRENGYSLLLGLNKISSKCTLLTMADHIFSKNVFSQMIKNYRREDILLATDPMYIKGYYDRKDATKVYGKKCFIIDIGKDLTHYNRLDMGVFILKTEIIKNICQYVESDFDKFGVSHVILSALNSDLNVGYYDFPNIIWLDIDNYQKYRQLIRLFNKSSNFSPFGLSKTEYFDYSNNKKKIQI
ncbi:MAG: NTP transferase domain-containing protein [Promethearchaeota archaeon]